MRSGLLAVAAAALCGGIAQAASIFSPAKPPAIPLAVRSPYLNTWLDDDAGGLLPGTWPKFWTGDIHGWQGFVRVDGTPYNWMGAAPGPSPVIQTSFQYTSTRSVFVFDVDGKVTMTVTFLSPVYPDDLLKQSLQFSYVDVQVESSDGGSHDVQVYMDISGEWVSGDNTKTINWSYGTSNNVAFHQVALAQQTAFSETSDQANWGTWFLSTSNSDDLTYKSAADVDCRGQFTANGTLDNNKDINFRAINNNWPVFAFAHDIGSVSSDVQSILFTIGVAQDQVINFQGNTPAPTALQGLWKSEYATDVDSMTAFFNDYADASTYSNSLDAKIQSDAVAAAGQDYATITTLAVRQSFGGLQVAQGAEQSYIFLKEISSDGDISTVDVIFPAHPLLLYLNATLVKLLLDPLFENQESGHYPNPWSIHDLGAFPNALGYPAGNDEAMPLEECGNMIIMTLAYAQRTGDNDYISKHWTLLDRWAQFLVNDSLIPANQLSTDDFAGTLANQTNLALKGIIGLRAMSEMAQLSGHADAYGSTASSYLSQWKTLAIDTAASPPHTTLAYGDTSSHGLLYNLYADRLLGLDFVGSDIYDMQSTFYPTAALAYGVPLDTRHTWTKSDWQMFCAAVASNSTRDMFTSLLVKWIDTTNADRPMTDLYDAGTGGFPSNGPTFVARPVMGGTFALLALPAGAPTTSSA